MTTLHRLRCLAPERLGRQLSPGFWARLAEAYTRPPRAYHNLQHVLHVAEWFSAWHGAWQCPSEVFAAVLFHDAVYVATEGDNEARSVELARQALAVTDLDVDLVACLIEATALSSVPPAREAGSDLALFIDCDRAVLGAPPDAYARYARAIAEEYSVLPPRVYQAGRRAFLQRTLRAGAPFLTPGMQERLGFQARENLEWELGILGN